MIVLPWQIGFWPAWMSWARKRRNVSGRKRRSADYRNTGRVTLPFGRLATLPRRQKDSSGDRYHQAAEDELLNEVGYLELRLPGLGRRFLADIRRAGNVIAQFPESGREILPAIRKHNLQRFPFSLIYSIEDDGLLILAVAHHSRRPQYWLNRVAESNDQS